MNDNNKKTTWVRESGFILAVIGSAVGFANILTFSAKCYKNGGGAFLIPYIVANLVVGLPFLFFEGTIGKKFGLPLVSAYGKVLPSAWKTFGWISVLACFTIGTFYMVLTGWSVAYTFFAGTNAIPADTATFFQKTFLRDSGDLFVLGGISWPIFLATLFVALFTWYVMSKNIGEGVEKVCSIFMPILASLVALFAVVVIFLPGATDGFYYLIKPDFSKLNFALWRDIFGQVFFSYSLGLGIMVGYARHSDKNINIKRAMIYVAIGDAVISIISGFAIFGCVGYMSQKTGVLFSEMVASGSSAEMGFIIFPMILQTFPLILQPVIGALFFFCVFIAGVTGVFSIVESVAGNVEVEFNLTRRKAVTLTLFFMTGGSLFFCMGNGTRLLGALDPMVLGNILLLGGIAQVAAFMIKSREISEDPIWQNNHQKKTIWYYALKYFSFAILTISLLGSLVGEFQATFTSAHIVRWTWFFVVTMVSIWAVRKVHVSDRYSTGNDGT